jgi:signal transduction histidine kinase
MARVLLDDRRNPGSVGRAVEMVAEAEEQVRALMARTRPPALHDGDLARAVVALRDDLANRYGLEVSVRWPDTPYPLPLISAVTVYRFFQEGLLNVVKHADVDAARVELIVDDEWVTAIVADQGPGFVLDEVTSEGGRHVGLGLLRERARLVGGAVEVTSWRGAGTTLALRLPRLPTAAAEVPAQAEPVAETDVAADGLGASSAG